MDKIINWLLLIIIFVFDPLAISLVVAANFAFDQAYPKRKYKENLYGEKIEDIEVKDAEEMTTQEEFMKNLDNLEKIKDWEAAERRMEIIGQNGNDGEHYSELDLNKDGVVDQEEIEKAQARINEIRKLKGGDLIPNSSWDKEIQALKNQIKNNLNNDDLTKTY
jgi:hypothetical protein